MNTEGSGGLGDLLEGQNLVVELIARGESRVPFAVGEPAAAGVRL